MGRPTKAQQAQIAERRSQAIALRIRGEDNASIARASTSWPLGYRDAKAVSDDIRHAMEQRIKDQAGAVDELREVEIAKLDALEQQVWAVLLREHVTVSHGRVIVIKDKDGEEHRLLDDGPTLAAVDRLLKIGERRARLVGLDSPVKVEAGVLVRFEVAGVDMEQLR